MVAGEACPLECSLTTEGELSGTPTVCDKLPLKSWTRTNPNIVKTDLPATGKVPCAQNVISIVINSKHTSNKHKLEFSNFLFPFLPSYLLFLVFSSNILCYHLFVH